MGVVLFLVWLGITADLHGESLALGALCALGVSWLNRGLWLPAKGCPFVPSWRTVGTGLSFLAGLCWDVVKANVQVALIVLSPRLRIEPGLVLFQPALENQFARVTLANAITLTPGTLTVELDDEGLLVHALNLGQASSLVDSPAELRLRRMEAALTGRQVGPVG